MKRFGSNIASIICFVVVAVVVVFCNCNTDGQRDGLQTCTLTRVHNYVNRTNQQ